MIARRELVTIHFSAANFDRLWALFVRGFYLLEDLVRALKPLRRLDPFLGCSLARSRALLTVETSCVDVVLLLVWLLRCLWLLVLLVAPPLALFAPDNHRETF